VTEPRNVEAILTGSKVDLFLLRGQEVEEEGREEAPSLMRTDAL
jgi:hypothetical protein